MGSKDGGLNTTEEWQSHRRHGLGLVPGIRTRILVSGTVSPTPIPRAPRTKRKKKSHSSTTLRSRRCSLKNKATGTASETPATKSTLHTPRTVSKKTRVSSNSTVLAAELSRSGTSDSLRSLCKPIDGVQSTDVGKNSPSSIRQKSLLNEDNYTAKHSLSITNTKAINHQHITHVGSKWTQQRLNIKSENLSSDILCKITQPRQIELCTFLGSDGDDTDTVIVEMKGPSSTDETKPVDCKDPQPLTSRNTLPFDSLRQLADSYIQLPVSSKISNTVQYSRSASVQYIPKEIDKGKGCEEAPLTEKSNVAEQRSLAFDSLRQLVNSSLKSSPAQEEQSAVDTYKRPRNKRACDKCSYNSKTSADLVKHMKYKHGPSMYMCPVKGCNFTTKYPSNIKHHQTKHTQVRPHQCGQCKMRFKRKNQLASHIMTHSDERPFNCDQCDFRTKRSWVLSQHVTSKHNSERRFECELCGFRMKTRSDMNKHRATHTCKRDIKCPNCDRMFTHKTRLRVHQKSMHSNTPTLPCTEINCTQRFKDNTALKKHVNIVHRGIRNFNCDVCRHAFSTKSNLEAHMVTHDPTGRPFKCPICPYSGKEDAHLRAHMGSMHGRQVPRFTCDICNVAFRIKVRLMKHLTTYKHQNARLRLPPQDREMKPDIVSVPTTVTCPTQVDATESIACGEGQQCLIIKQEVSTENSGSEKHIIHDKS